LALVTSKPPHVFSQVSILHNPPSNGFWPPPCVPEPVHSPRFPSLPFLYFLLAFVRCCRVPPRCHRAGSNHAHSRFCLTVVAPGTIITPESIGWEPPDVTDALRRVFALILACVCDLQGCEPFDGPPGLLTVQSGRSSARKVFLSLGPFQFRFRRRVLVLYPFFLRDAVFLLSLFFFCRTSISAGGRFNMLLNPCFLWRFWGFSLHSPTPSFFSVECSFRPVPGF